MTKFRTLFALALVVVASAIVTTGTRAGRDDDKKPSNPPAAASESKVTPAQNAEERLVEGQERFHANCGRCHAAPHKFPPRMMATIVRHMRVRATITDEDMRLILEYMTQ